MKRDLMLKGEILSDNSQYLKITIEKDDIFF